MTAAKRKIPARRVGAEDSATRTLLLTSAARLMIEEGHAAVTTRRLAERAGLKPQLVYYYFHTMDDLFLAMYQRVVDVIYERMEKALATDNPVKALWEFSSYPAGTALALELWALANHRKGFHKLLADSTVEFRKLGIKHLTQFFQGRVKDPEDLAFLISALIVGLSRPLVSEKTIGTSMGHAEVLALVQAGIQHLSDSSQPIDSIFLKDSRLKTRARKPN